MVKTPKTIKHTQYAPFWNGKAYNVWLYSYATGHKLRKYKTEFSTIESAWDFIDWLNESDSMNNIELTIEKGASEFQSRWINYAFNELMYNSKPKPSIDKMVEAMQSISDCIEANVGRGGSHVWVSNPNNERIAIIKFN